MCQIYQNWNYIRKLPFSRITKGWSNNCFKGVAIVCIRKNNDEFMLILIISFKIKTY